LLLDVTSALTDLMKELRSGGGRRNNEVVDSGQDVHLDICLKEKREVQRSTGMLTLRRILVCISKTLLF